MGRRTVEYKGKYASFSSIVDSFVTKFMDKKGYELWMGLEYGKHFSPIESNTKSMDDACFAIKLNHTRDEAIECLVESGLSQEESIKLIDKELY